MHCHQGMKMQFTFLSLCLMLLLLESKKVWSLIFLKLSNKPRNLFEHSIVLSYVMVLCFIWASEVPCDMSWRISHFPPPPIPPEQCVPIILTMFNWSKVFIYMIWETWIKIGRLYVRRWWRYDRISSWWPIFDFFETNPLIILKIWVLAKENRRSLQDIPYIYLV